MTARKTKLIATAIILSAATCDLRAHDPDGWGDAALITFLISPFWIAAGCILGVVLGRKLTKEEKNASRVVLPLTLAVIGAVVAGVSLPSLFEIIYGWIR